MQEPNWIVVALIGAFLGWIMPYVINSFRYARNRMKKNEITGNWYEYSWSTQDGKIIILSGKVIVKIGLLSPYKVIFHESGKVYKGTAYIEHDHLCSEVRVDDVLKETMQMRFSIPTLTNRDVIPGFWLSYNFNNRVACGVTLLSRSELQDTELTKITVEKIKDSMLELSVIN